MKCVLLLSLVVQCVVGISASSKFVPEVTQQFPEAVHIQLEQHVKHYMQLDMLYKAYAAYFSRADVALTGFSKYFQGHSDHMRGQAVALTQYINMRGGNVGYTDVEIRRPCKTIIKDTLEKFSITLKKRKAFICKFQLSVKKARDAVSQSKITTAGLTGLEDALAMEQWIIEKTLDALNTAKNKKDALTKHHLEEFLEMERPKGMRMLIDRLRLYTGEDYSVGEYIMDRELNGEEKAE